MVSYPLFSHNGHTSHCYWTSSQEAGRPAHLWYLSRFLHYEPKLLRCFHVFCKQCLERLVVHDFQGLLLLCPSCGHPHFFLLPFCRGKMINKLSHPSHSAGSCWLAWQKMATSNKFLRIFFRSSTTWKCHQAIPRAAHLIKGTNPFVDFSCCHGKM